MRKDIKNIVIDIQHDFCNTNIPKITPVIVRDEHNTMDVYPKHCISTNK